MVWFIRKNLGFIVTSIWIVGILILWILGDLKKPTSLNELGDFLAGAFAPIAFLWLVLGYKQQGKQLEQNSTAIDQQAKALQNQADTLKQQIMEMKENVKQQAELADIQKQQFRAMLNAASGIIEIVSYTLSIQPNNNLVNNEIEYTYIFEFTLKAYVNELRNLKVLRYETSYEEINKVAVGDSENIRLLIFSEHDKNLGEFVRKEVEKYEFNFIISYQTIYGEEKREKFLYEFVEMNGEVKARKSLWK